MPPEGVAVDGVLGLQALGAVLADDLDPRLGKLGHVLHGHVLGGRDDGDPRPDLCLDRLVPRPDSLRDIGDHPLAAGPRRRPVDARRRAPGCSRCRDQCGGRRRRRRRGAPARPRSRDRAGPLGRRRHRSARERAPRLRPPPRSSTARSLGRSQRRASAAERRAPLSTIPASRPRQPTWRAAAPGRSPFARTSATGRQSAVKTSRGSPGESDQRPSPGSPGFPHGGRRRRAPACRSAEARRRCRFPQPTAARFSRTCSGSSSVNRPRLRVSNGASLTPPRRVENATAYGPGASQRISVTSLSGDQLLCGREFGFAALELAA